jgi:hypothetical protein
MRSFPLAVEQPVERPGLGKGYLIEEQGMTYLTDTDPDLALGPLQAAACNRIALGPRAGQKVLSLQTVPTAQPTPGVVWAQEAVGQYAALEKGIEFVFDEFGQA